jgi:hypothetical protein
MSKTTPGGVWGGAGATKAAPEGPRLHGSGERGPIGSPGGNPNLRGALHVRL